MRLVGRPASRGVLSVLLGCGLIAWGLWTIGGDLAAEPFRKAALHIERRGLPDPAALERLESAHAALLDTPRCRRDLTKAAATIRLARVDVLAAGSDAAVIDASDAAARTLRADLTCRPADGNLWLRLALVEIRRQGLTEDVESLFKLSAWTMPTDNWVLADRVRFLGPIVQSGIERLNDVYDKDVERFARYARTRDVVELYLASPAVAQARQSAVWDQLGPERAEELRVALDAEMKKRSR